MLCSCHPETLVAYTTLTGPSLVVRFQLTSHFLPAEASHLCPRFAVSPNPAPHIFGLGDWKVVASFAGNLYLASFHPGSLEG